MNFFSLEFCLLLAGALVLFYVIPPRFSTLRSLILLAACGAFYYCSQRQYLFLLPCSIVISYLSAMVMDRIESQTGRRAVLWLSVLLIAGAMIVFRYSSFIADTVFRLTGRRFGEGLDLIAPLGISVYTLRILSYLADVCRRKYAHWVNPVKYAVYVAFFPSILAGPIDRADTFLPQLDKPQRCSYEQLQYGALLMLWGVFLKLVAADRLAIFAGNVYGSYASQPGSYLLLATFAYALLAYCDFFAYSSFARGVGALFGFSLKKSFASPYLSQSVAEFWRSWHVSLSSWLRDYVYIPLGGSRCGRFRRYVNLTLTFLIGSLWYGASWNFLVWGALNAAFLIFEDLISPVLPKAAEGKKGRVVRILKRVAVFLALCPGWVFFFGNGTRNALKILLRIVTEFNAGALFSPELFSQGLYKADVCVVLYALLVLRLADRLSRQGKDAVRSLQKLYLPYRWFLYIVLIFSVLLFGKYGTVLAPVQFLFVQP